MNNYTDREMCDMHFVYGVADGNAEAARRIYQERYPDRHVPCARTFVRIHERLNETGSFKKRGAGNGRPAAVPLHVEEAVLHAVEEDPTTSTRKIAANLNISNVQVWRILKNQLLYPYHIQRVQALLPADFPQRLAMCQWFQHKITQNPRFLESVLFTDEANFSREAIINFHNNHVWAEENPHTIVQGNYQQKFSLNVWAGIVGNYLIGPYFLPDRLTGQSYRHFLEEELPMLLEDVPYQIRNEMWFLHDGCPAHFSLLAREFLNQEYPNRWIGRGGPQAWSPRSPDLNMLDYFLWGHLKSLVYTTPVNTVEELRDRIVESCNTIRNTPGIFQRVRESLNRRLEACVNVDGGHFQQFL